MKSKLYLIRHALPETLNYDKFSDPGLGEQGQRQAKKIADFLLDKGISRIWCSSNERAKQTSAAFLQRCGLSSDYCRALEERKPSLESHESLVRRVHQWWREQRAEALSQLAAIFGHCGTLNMILEYEDSARTKLNYSFEDEYLCHTPIAGIWLLNFEKAVLQNGRIIARFDHV